MTWLIAIKKTTFHKIFSKNLERIVEVKVHFSILGMLVRKSPRLKKNYSEANYKIQWKIVALKLSKRIVTALTSSTLKQLVNNHFPCSITWFGQAWRMKYIYRVSQNICYTFNHQ